MELKRLRPRLQSRQQQSRPRNKQQQLANLCEPNLAPLTSAHIHHQPPTPQSLGAAEDTLMAACRTGDVRQVRALSTLGDAPEAMQLLRHSLLSSPILPDSLRVLLLGSLTTLTSHTLAHPAHAPQVCVLLRQQQQQQEQAATSTTPALLVNHQQRDTGLTPLAAACAAGHRKVVQLLLGAGADCYLHDAEDASPLMHAVRGGHAAVVQVGPGGACD